MNMRLWLGFLLLMAVMLNSSLGALGEVESRTNVKMLPPEISGKTLRGSHPEKYMGKRPAPVSIDRENQIEDDTQLLEKFYRPTMEEYVKNWVADRKVQLPASHFEQLEFEDPAKKKQRTQVFNPSRAQGRISTLEKSGLDVSQKQQLSALGPVALRQKLAEIKRLDQMKKARLFRNRNS